MTKDQLFTELSIRLAVIEAKVDKLLELNMQPNWTVLDHERGSTRTYPIPEEWKADKSFDEEFSEEFK